MPPLPVLRAPLFIGLWISNIIAFTCGFYWGFSCPAIAWPYPPAGEKRKGWNPRNRGGIHFRLPDLRLCKARIEINQVKSSGPLVFPLTEEIGNALIDYIRYGRPVSQLRKVFLRANAPFKPFGKDNNLHYIITRYRRRATINLPVQNRKGMHSLRHTMASRLLEAGIPLETISGIMGHISMDTTRIYTKVNIKALQSVAIDPEEVTHA